MEQTPVKKARRKSPDGKDPISWSLGAIRILQKDVDNLLAVNSDLVRRVATLEMTSAGRDSDSYLTLPPITPAVAMFSASPEKSSVTALIEGNEMAMKRLEKRMNELEEQLKVLDAFVCGNKECEKAVNQPDKPEKLPIMSRLESIVCENNMKWKWLDGDDKIFALIAWADSHLTFLSNALRDENKLVDNPALSVSKVIIDFSIACFGITIKQDEELDNAHKFIRDLEQRFDSVVATVSELSYAACGDADPTFNELAQELRDQGAPEYFISGHRHSQRTMNRMAKRITALEFRLEEASGSDSHD